MLRIGFNSMNNDSQYEMIDLNKCQELKVIINYLSNKNLHNHETTVDFFADNFGGSELSQE